ncbi:two-component system chemotaxis sensor kinase CheA [Sporomusaceae bacterium BoRhaA]|uniref:chemotaxis protein CheA n=1 Tax=Pelorhabdus rhamnosifermentans TaxID=2772457 RepID=UPI001C0620E1|nr:chemotaxis protein CheA [Pelorhabdus rhamnosifermentans]MBU2701799.1 two-component system chemotaxis sensor kinase CheA [Pelorhabdus rhamnosifermentans]
MIDDENLLRDFVIDAKEHTETIEVGLLQWEQGQYNQKLINEIFRAAHSIKGTAGFFELKNIVDLSHAMESVLGKIRSQTVIVGLQITDILLEANDELKNLLEHVADSETVDISHYITKLRAVITLDQGTSLLCVSSQKQGKTDDWCMKYREKLKKICKHGRKFYQFISKSFLNNGNEEEFCVNMASNIQSIGTLLTYYIRDNSAQTSTLPVSGKKVVFLFSTVLEHELVVMALGAIESEIVQLDIHRQEAEIFQLLVEAERGPDAQEAVLPALSVEEPQSFFEDEKAFHSNHVEERIKVAVDVLNELVNLSSEMILARNQLVRTLANCTEPVPGIRPILQKMDHTITEMQEKIMRTRMQPVANLFHSMPRLVRELSKKLRKNLDLQIQGEHVELDKSIIEGLVDPFTHLVRNALDHGIELPAVRKKLGKDPRGKLEIKAYHESGRVIIDMKDDGAGLHLDKIKQQALRQEVITAEQAAKMSEVELIQLIFLPGLSTVNQVNELSGRGVGLDVVRSNIEKLGGTVEVYTVINKGTTFRLILPLSLAVIPSLIITIDEHSFALPQVNLQEIVRMGSDLTARKIEWVQGYEVIRMSDGLVPIIHLTDVIGVPHAECSQSLAAKILILKTGTKKFGLVIDSIDDWEEILVKPLSRYLKKQQAYSGVTILGDGRIALVLDVDGIAKAASLLVVEQAVRKFSTDVFIMDQQNSDEQEVLLFQCSGPEILALPLTMIARVEKVQEQQIERMGSKEYYHVKGKIIQLIRPEDYLPITMNSVLQQTAYLVILKKFRPAVALVVSKIVDTVQASLQVLEGGPEAKGLWGSVLLHDKIVLSVHAEELFHMAYCEAEKGRILAQGGQSL